MSAVELIVPQALHIRAAGQSQDLTFAELDLPADAADDRVLAAVASHLGQSEASFSAGHTIDRSGPTPVVRPFAVYG